MREWNVMPGWSCSEDRKETRMGFFCFMEDETVWWNFGGNFFCCHRLYPPTCCSRREPLRRINLSSTFFVCFWLFFHFYFYVVFFYFSLLRMCLEFISAPFTVSRRGTSALARQGIQLITHSSGGDPSAAHPSADPFTQRGALLPRCLCSTAPELFLPVAQPLAQID